MQEHVANPRPVRHSDSLVALGVAGAAAAIRAGELSAETYAAALLRQAREQSDLNAFITIDETAVMTAARDADKARSAGASGPLLGVPLGIKDSYLTRGLRTTLGVSNLKDFIPDRDAEAVSAIKEAGGLILGKNNLVEMSYGLTGNNSPYGQVRNPHARNRVTGGSSSGSAASVAGGIVPAALGGDTVGSIRVPASLCGVVGFKPTTGRWPRAGVAPISHVLDTTGVFARSVEDCELIDQVMTNAPASTPFDDIGLKGIKFAYAPRQYLDLVDAEIEVRFKETVQRLRDAGAEIVEVNLGEDFTALAERTTWNIFFHDTMEAISAFLQDNGIPTSFDEIHHHVKAQLKEVWQHAVRPNGPGSISADLYGAALAADRPEIQRRFNEAFATAGAEALLFPTTPCTAPLIESQYQFSIADKDVSYVALAKNTVPASGGGLPGISIPMGLSRNGLPIGLEIDAPLGRDRRLLTLARSVEAWCND